MSIFERRATSERSGVSPAFAIGHTDVEWTADLPGADGQGSPHPRILHAALVEAPGPVASWFQDVARTRGVWRALCGAEVLVVTPAPVGGGSRWTCASCGTIVSRWLEDVDQVRWESRVELGL